LPQRSCFDPRIEIEVTGGYRDRSRTASPRPAHPADEQTVEGSLDFVEAAVSRPGCSGVVTGSEPATIGVRKAPYREPVASEILPPFALTVTLGMPRLISHVACPAGATPNLQWQWWRGFRTLHAKSHRRHAGGRAVRDPQLIQAAPGSWFKTRAVRRTARHTRGHQAGAAPHPR
jgi:hypothetical protein